MNTALDRLRVAVNALETLGDGELLSRFLARSDEGAFEAIVRRHGPMVLDVCKRVAGNEHDAEDAFQATFIVLVRKASSIIPRDLVGNWLYGVAYRTAQATRGKNVRRHIKVRQVADMPQPGTDHEPTWQDLLPYLDQELNRLPDRYRVPLVLCELEGRSRRDVARQLEIPEGTLSSRLAMGRKKLADRLTRRGLAIAPAFLGALFAQNAAQASLPAPLFGSIVKSAALLAAGEAAAVVASAEVVALSEGVLKAMFLTKLKMTVLGLAAVAMLTLGGIFAHQQLAAEGERKPAERKAQPTERKPIDANAEGTRVRNPNMAAGTIESVDAAKNTITLRTVTRTDPQGADKTYPLAKDATIQRNGKDAKLADLKKGSRASLTLTADQKSVTAVNAMTPPVAGPLKSVDAAKNTITITIGGRADKQDKTYTLTKDAKIGIEGNRNATLADLKEGSMLNLIVEDDGTVSQVRTQIRGIRQNEE